MTPLARLTIILARLTILARTPGIPDSTPLTMGGEVELEVTMGDLRALVDAAQGKTDAIDDWWDTEVSRRKGFAEAAEAELATIDTWMRGMDITETADDGSSLTRVQRLAAEQKEWRDAGMYCADRCKEAAKARDAAEANLARARELLFTLKVNNGRVIDNCWEDVSRFLTEGEGT